VHETAPVAVVGAKVPAEQAAHAVAETAYWPPGHAVQLGMLEFGAMAPAAHGEQAVEPEAAAVPGPQGRHRLLLNLYVPAAHCEQTIAPGELM